MKHIISLSLKYIRRQKMRTVLTFLCVTLSVFILCTFGAYIGSTLQTLRNKVQRENGAYEADISSWLKEMKYDEIKGSFDIIQNHIIVSDYNTYYYNSVVGKGDESVYMGDRFGDDNNMMMYAEVNDGKSLKRFSGLTEMVSNGNSKLMDERNMRLDAGRTKDFKDTEGSTVPVCFKDMGYSVGDTLTFSVRPVVAEIDEDSPLMKEVRRKLLDEFGSSVMRDDTEFFELDEEEQNKTSQKYLKDVFEYYGMELADVPMKNIEYGESVEVSIRIAGFNEESGLCIISSDIDNAFIHRLIEKNSGYKDYPAVSAKVRINENSDFDEGMETLYGALGFKRGNYYADLPELNYDLLFYEFRSAGALVEMFPSLIVIFVLIFFAWLVARFVIDNAFEISAQERSSQFATLRIIGTSKTQISALVFTEAIFYTITAVPLGTVIAYLLCSLSFNALKNVGFQDFEFRANVYFVIGGIILCIFAIFISAYTSAMWASRKLSPAEALNFGKPKKKSKKLRKRKSKINLSSERFLRRYISKNIGRSKGRFIISTITMTLGTMFFTFSVMLGLFMYSSMGEAIDSDISDFDINVVPLSAYDEIKETFCENEAFEEVNITSYADFSECIIDMNETDKTDFEKLIPYKTELNKLFLVKGIDEYNFDKYIAGMSGMTYDEFVQSGKAIYNISCCQAMYDEYGKPVRQYDDFYHELDTPLTIKYLNNISLDVTGYACNEFDSYQKFCVIIPIDSELAQKFNMNISIDMKVNGNNNYPEAEKIYNEFVEKADYMWCDNNYMLGTGRYEFIKAIIKIVVTFVASIWLVGILSMINSINTSILNRSRELIMLRSVGMSRKQLRKLVLIESFMFSALSSSIGIIIAIGAFFLLMNSLHFNVTFLVSMAVGLILAIVLNVVIAVLASIPASKNLEKAESLIKTF